MSKRLSDKLQFSAYGFVCVFPLKLCPVQPGICNWRHRLPSTIHRLDAIFSQSESPLHSVMCVRAFPSQQNRSKWLFARRITKMSRNKHHKPPRCYQKGLPFDVISTNVDLNKGIKSNRMHLTISVSIDTLHRCICNEDPMIRRRFLQKSREKSSAFILCTYTFCDHISSFSMSIPRYRLVIGCVSFEMWKK